jgi:hypothetical protein
MLRLFEERQIWVSKNLRSGIKRASPRAASGQTAQESVFVGLDRIPLIPIGRMGRHQGLSH